MKRSVSRAWLCTLLLASLVVSSLTPVGIAGGLPAETKTTVKTGPMAVSAEPEKQAALVAAFLGGRAARSGAASPASLDPSEPGYIWMTSHTNGGTYSYPLGSIIRVTTEAMDQNNYGYYFEIVGIWDNAIQDFVALYSYDTFVYYARSGYADVDTSGLAVSTGRYEIVALLWDYQYDEIEDAESFYLNITYQNYAPVANPDTYSVAANVTKNVAAPGVLANDTDANGDALTVQGISPTTHGTLSLNANGSFTYTPYAGYVGSDSFTYRVYDGRAYSEVVTVTLNVTNAAPVAVTDAYGVRTDSARTVDASKGVLANDTDVDGQTLTAEKMSDPANGTVTLNPNGSFTYTPTGSFEGDDTFTYRAYDGIAYSGTVAVTITVGNTAPLAVADTYSTNVNAQLVNASGVLANDSDFEGDQITAEKVSDPSHGTLTLDASGAFTYTPATDYIGSDSFTYRVYDGLVYSNTATVTISVVNPTPPMAVYRFYRPSSGTHFYTADVSERDRVIATMSSTYAFEGVCYTVNTSNPSNSVPLHRFYNRRSGTHLYTANGSEASNIMTNLSSTYSYDGIAYFVSSGSGLQIHRFYSPGKGVHFYSADPNEIAYVRANLGATWQYEGPAYFVGQ